MRPRFLIAALLVPLVVAGCGDDEPTNSVPVLEGTYVATQFVVAPTGLPSFDVLSAGGSLTITIAANGATTGTLIVPAIVTGTGQSQTISMVGTAVQSGNTVTFEQASDSFIRDLEWTLDAVGLHTSSQVAGVGTFTVRLTRQ